MVWFCRTTTAHHARKFTYIGQVPRIGRLLRLLLLDWAGGETGHLPAAHHVVIGLCSGFLGGATLFVSGISP